MSSQYNENRVKIQEYFDKKGIKSLEVEPVGKKNADKEPIYVVTKRESLYMDYIPEMLLRKFGNELYSEMVEKSYEIVDIELLKRLLKEAGISALEFKKCIKVNVTVSKQKMKQLFEVGEITTKKLQGCYTAKIVKSIQIKAKKDDGN